MTRHGVLYFLARVGAGLLMIATLAILTRLLTPEAYGLYALGVTGATIAGTLLFQWLSVAVWRYYAVYADRPGVLIAATEQGFWAAAGLAVAASGLSLLLRPSIGLGLAAAVLGATLALGRYNLLLQIANAQGDPRRYTLLSWSRSAAGLAVGTALVLLGAGAIGAVIGFAAGHLIALLLFRPFRTSRPERTAEARVLAAKLLRYGLPLALTFLGTLAVDFAARFLIGWMLGVERVGPYAAAYDLALQSIGAITNVLYLAAFPGVLLAYERSGEEVARARLLSLGRALLLVGLPAAAGFAALSGDIAAVLLGEAFRSEAAQVMALLAAAIWLSGFKSYYLDAVFMLRQATRYLAYVALAMAAANVTLNLLLLSVLGTMGAAWATLAAVLLGSALSYIAGRGQMRLPRIRGDLLKALAASSLMALVLRAFPPSAHILVLLAKVLLGGVTYGVAALLLNVADVRAWAVLRLRAYHRPN